MGRPTWGREAPEDAGSSWAPGPASITGRSHLLPQRVLRRHQDLARLRRANQRLKKRKLELPEAPARRRGRGCQTRMLRPGLAEDGGNWGSAVGAPPSYPSLGHGALSSPLRGRVPRTLHSVPFPLQQGWCFWDSGLGWWWWQGLGWGGGGGHDDRGLG